MAVRAEQYARNIERRSRIREVIDPVGPAAGREALGAVEQQTAAATQQIVETASVHVDVGQAPADQVRPLAEVVADVDRGDLLDEMTVHLLEVHQLGEQ